MAEATALPALKELVALQNSRLVEIRHFKEELKRKPFNTLSKYMIELRIQAIQEIRAEVLQTNSEIMARENVATEPYVVEGIFGRIQTAYTSLLEELVNIKVCLSTTNFDFGRPASPTSDGLPKFSGDCEDYERFAALFVRIVHPKTTNDTTRLMYLKQCLEGEAADSIQHLYISDESYAEAWKRLKMYFYNPRRAVNDYLDDLINMDTLEQESSADLCELNNKALRIVRSLTNLGMPVEKWDMWFVHILSSKLDEKTRRAWIEKQVDRELSAFNNADKTSAPWVIPDAMNTFPTLSEFRDFLEKRSEFLYGIEQITRADERVLNNHATTVKCNFCSGSHRAAKCNVFIAKTVQERKLEVKRLRLCYNCLGRHKISACNSKGRCNTCRSKHHTLLHVDSNVTA